jgi:hypothetical protein
MTAYALPAPNPVIGGLLTLTVGRPARVDLTDTALVVELGVAWRATVPRTAITGVRREPRTTVSVGAHGWRGRWLVNTVGRNLVVVDIEPAVTARLYGLPVRLRELAVSLEDPTAFIEALGVPLT